MFQEKIRQIFAALDLTASEYARIVRCDKSHVSRLLSGARTPRRGGLGAQRLCRGLYLCAEEKGKIDRLCRCLGCPLDAGAEEIETKTGEWLYEGQAPEESTARKKEKAPYRAFGEKLGAAMDLLGVSNMRLGRALNIDPSYISRFRSGLRLPRSNPKLLEDLCTAIVDRAYEQGKEKELVLLANGNLSEISGKEQTARVLENWLFRNDGAADVPLIEGLIDHIGSFSAEIRMPVQSLEEAVNAEILAETESLYRGASGLRRAVLRFLGCVIANRARELRLYSDQNMDWMTQDPDFLARWSALMALCVRGGTKITVIHTVDRELREMAMAIQSWLPLYPSGGIRSYYRKSAGTSEFSHTLFLCPGYACISGANVAGTEENDGVYRYDTDETTLQAYENAFSSMLNGCGQLAHAFTTGEVGRFGAQDVSRLTILGNTLSLATMPEKTLRSALLRAGADEETVRRIDHLRCERLKVLTRCAGQGYIHELLPSASPAQLLEGKTPMDLPGFSLFYTPEEYAWHVQNVIALSETLNGYRFFALSEAPFADVKLMISRRVVAAVRLREPYFTLLLEHPGLCRAFELYAEKIQEQYQTDKRSTKKLLQALQGKNGARRERRRPDT